MKLDDLLNDVKKAKTKQAEAARKGVKKADDGAVGSQIPQNLSASIEHEMPKNIATEAQQGDQQKVMELLEAIEQSGEAAGAAENLTEAKIAEEMVMLDQAIIDRQAEYFGVKMAESFVSRVVELNNPPVSVKEAEEYVKVAAEEEYSRWFNAGQALFDGYAYKAAEFPAMEGGEGIIDNGGQPVPSAVNDSEVDALAADLTQYLASEEALEEGKTAAEKEAKISDMFGKIKTYFSSMAGKMKSVAAHPAAIPTAVGAGMVGGVGYGGYQLGKHTEKPSTGKAIAAWGLGGVPGGVGYSIGRSVANAGRETKQSSDAGSIISAFKSGVISKKEAAEKLLPLMN